MSDPKIKVGADMSAVEKEMGKLTSAAQKIIDTLSGSSVGLDVKQAKADLESLAQTATSVTDALKGVSTVKGGDVSKIAEKLAFAADHAEQLEKVLQAVGQSTGFGQTVRNSAQFANNMERARRAQESLSKEGIKASKVQAEAALARYESLRASGARGTAKLPQDFAAWASGGYRQHSISDTENKRHFREVLKGIGIDPGGAGEEAKSRWGKRAVGALGGAAGGIAGSIMNGGDGFFSAVGSAGGGLIGTGAGAMIGGAPGAAIGAVVGTVGSKVLGAFGAMLDQSLQRVLKDAINLTDLRHSISATGIDFNQMRQDVRNFTADLRLTNEEASALARSFSNAYGQVESSQQLAAGTKLGAGFSRSFGVDPSMGVAFFGNMRRMGQEADTHLALKISEAVSKNGVTPQMGSVLSALQNFTESQTRLTFTKANADGYTSFMSSMLGGAGAGSKDVGAVSNAMGAADSALRQGGAFGEASKAFMLGTYQRKLPGFNVFDLKWMQEQGAFGTIAGAFGKGSRAYEFAQQNGDKAMMARYARYAAKGGNETALSINMRSLDERAHGNTNEFITSIGGMFGTGPGQSAALYAAYKRKGGLGNLEKQLKAAGVTDLSKIDPKQFGDIAQVAGMNDGQIRAQAQKLLGDSSLNLDAREKNALQSASVDTQREAVLKITALHDTQKDEGEKIDQLNASMKRMADDVTTRLTPAMIGAKEYLFKLVQHFMPSVVDLSAPGSSTLDPKKFSGGQKRVAEFIENYGRQKGWSTEKIDFMKGEAFHESGMVNRYGPVITNPKSMHYGQRASGFFQVMPKTAQAWGADINDVWATSRAAMDHLSSNYDKYGPAGAAVGHLTGDPRKLFASDGYQTGQQYAQSVIADARAFSKFRSNDVVVMPGIGPVGSGQGPTQPAPTALHSSVTIRLEDPSGKPIPHTVVKTEVHAPAPAGTHR